MAAAQETSMLTFADGHSVPALGQGTWHMGDSPAVKADEIRALRVGIDLGLTVIDTAEMYGDGRAERLVGEAVAGRREQVFLVSKVLPHHADRHGVQQACERSLRRLRTDRLDLYLLHWRGPYPLEETVAGLEALKAAGKIVRWGVSNFDADDMDELAAVADGAACATDQVLYNLARRGVEFDLLPWCERRGMPVMAYSPVEQGRLLGHAALTEVASRHEATPAQIALAWILRRPGILAIPKAGSEAHVRENAQSRDVVLAAEDLAVLDRAFPPPTAKMPLAVL